MGTQRDNISVLVAPETRREVRVAAAKQDLSMADWVRQAIDERLQNQSSVDAEGVPINTNVEVTVEDAAAEQQGEAPSSNE